MSFKVQKFIPVTLNTWDLGSGGSDQAGKKTREPGNPTPSQLGT